MTRPVNGPEYHLPRTPPPWAQRRANSRSGGGSRARITTPSDRFVSPLSSRPALRRRRQVEARSAATAAAITGSPGRLRLDAGWTRRGDIQQRLRAAPMPALGQDAARCDGRQAHRQRSTPPGEIRRVDGDDDDEGERLAVGQPSGTHATSPAPILACATNTGHHDDFPLRTRRSPPEVVIRNFLTATAFEQPGAVLTDDQASIAPGIARSRIAEWMVNQARGAPGSTRRRDLYRPLVHRRASAQHYCAR